MKLDLSALSRSDGPTSELQARREKYAFFEKQCSEVADGLFLGSDVVARNREVLRAAGITHVINCVGFLYPAYFQEELTYLVLYLQGQLSIKAAQCPAQTRAALCLPSDMLGGCTL